MSPTCTSRTPIQKTNATKTTTNVYSTRPCPYSSLQSRFNESIPFLLFLISVTLIEMPVPKAFHVMAFITSPPLLFETKKNRLQSFCCRFHHSLTDPLGDHVGVSVHRINVFAVSLRIDCAREHHGKDWCVEAWAVTALSYFAPRLRLIDKQICQRCHVRTIYKLLA